jgi:SNF2 family DNA or RNA helicase
LQILEALLRLRQVACHPGLVDPSLRDGPSGKLDLLQDELEQVIDSGHKALVFSQFTALLALVRERLDRGGTAYAYLDGQTRDRQAVVTRFQEDPQCPLFLISLRAGGLGLNLTAADYVFILDPWWNPAVEAQAIDRAHRIGRSGRVVAYRLVTRDTVEEKICTLQASKRDLAHALVAGEGGGLSSLTPEDLGLLFGP